jgi:transcriptional regulator with XRE-family HTH domain
VVFRVLGENGWTQRAIGAAAGMRQSEVSEILRGRRVRDYRVLVRIADGSATALARMGDPDGAATELAKARELWQPTSADPWGDLEGAAARVALEDGRLDEAEPLAAASVRRWEAGHSQRARTLGDVLLATIHVRAGEPDGLPLAHGAITGVMKLSSVRARQHLNPLAAALETRPGGDHRELARTARHLATTRA